MSRFVFGLSLSSVLGTLIAVAGCSSDASAPPTPGDGGSGGEPAGGAGNVPLGTGGVYVPPTGTGGVSTGTGGVSTGTGGVSTGTGGVSTGTGGSTPVGGDLSITECPNPPMVYPLDVVQSFPECTLCEGARCVPTTLVPAEQQTLLATCDATNSCVPEGYATSGGSFLAKTCTSLEYQPGMAAEGRCISVCVPAVAAQVDQLPLDTCASGEKCAPCWEPIDGALTGACGIACDTWTQGAVERFTECGANPLDATDPKRGVCVPPELVPAELLNAVPPETCTGGWLCAPKEKARDLTMKFPTCVPGGAAALLVQNGACVPAYLVPADQVPLIGPLGTAPCAQDEYCAPCTNPLVIDPATMLPEVTGACN